LPESRVVIGDFFTGSNILDLDTVSHEWQTRRNRADELSCVVNLADPVMRALDLRNTATPGKTYLAKLIDDNVMAFGRILPHQYNKARRTLTLRAQGVEESYFRRRSVLPAAALTTPLIDPTTGEPSAATNTVLSGWDMGTTLKKVIQQSMLWTGGNLPIIFEDDRAGTHEDTILGSSLMPITTMLENYAARQNGPDWEFSPRLTADRKGIQLLFRTGTEEQPRLRSSSIVTFDYSVPEPSIDDLVAEIDASDMTSLAWTIGGRETGEAVVAFAQNTALVAAGYALDESVDNDHDTASESTTLQDYSDERIRNSSKPKEFWPFRVRTDAQPSPVDSRKGDLVDVLVRDDDYYPDDTYRRAIDGLSGTEDPDWITITASEIP